MKKMKAIIPEKLWRRETVFVGEDCLPTRLVLSSAQRNGENDSLLTDYLMKHRHVMCKTHFKCLNYAGDQNWDGFDCRSCPRAVDPNNKISESEILDDIRGLLLLQRVVRTANLNTSQIPPCKNPSDPSREQFRPPFRRARIESE
jgi:hypothetical protein